MAVSRRVSALAVVVALVAGVLVVGGGPVSAQVPVVSCGGGGGLSERVRWDQSPVVTSSLRVPAGATVRTFGTVRNVGGWPWGAVGR